MRDLQNIVYDVPKVIQLEWLDGDVVFARKEPCHLDSYLTEQEPLRQRAWALQEQLLSTRLLTFGKEELRWNCKTKQKCQCGEYPNLDTINLKSLPSHFSTSIDAHVMA